MAIARILQNTDDFNRADSNSLGANWGDLTTAGGNGALHIVSTAVGHGAGGNNGGSAARWIGAGTFTNDHWSSIQPVWANSGTWFGALARASADQDALRDYYLFQIQDTGGGSAYRLVSVVNGTTTVLKSGTVNATGSIDIEVSGTTVNGCLSGVVIDTATDSTLTTGSPGIWQSDVTPLMDNWQGGSLITVSAISASPAGLSTMTPAQTAIGYLAMTPAGTSTMTYSLAANLAVTMTGTGVLSGPLQFYSGSTVHMYGGWSMGNVTLGWNANTESDLAGYKIYIGTSSGVYNYATTPYVSPVNVGLVTTFSFVLLPGGATYYFAITAFNTTGGESAFSSELVVPIETYHAYSMTLTGVNAITGAAAGTSQLLGNLINVGGLILMLDLDTGGIGTLSAFGLAAKAGAMSAFPNLGATSSQSFTLTGTGDLGHKPLDLANGALTGTLGGTGSLMFISGSPDGFSDMQAMPSLSGSMTMVITGQGLMFSAFHIQTGMPQKQYRTKLQAGEVHRSPKR